MRPSAGGRTERFLTLLRAGVPARPLFIPDDKASRSELDLLPPLPPDPQNQVQHLTAG